ncbi:n-acetyltransferase 9 [Conidiobolus coronatus NRRL 28638]|uniref:N-acetyltransferase 9 n=1 Tax=Conidiobolus coronatus (strain ATCC 28846 / CBS 209.66 / NRRL 28638) TaxID=796925 RepID=A0A137PG41_CONC2|nr:n-acetyltransferase 9 [Conidiobolus coronatus NRRL 28638]|eukprot:KXN73940.1 n-acetyltransferase 9 [Conidiobolus coronatus NRRL 28638]
MLLNYNTVLDSEKLTLVPYRPEHVAKYHDWMEDEEIREQTASERLSLKEEYEMQESWKNDQDKCTFIILDKVQSLSNGSDEVYKPKMIGDVNIFIHDFDGEKHGELELMIAEKSYRKKGYGTQAIFLMMAYGHLKIGLKRYEVKIGVENQASINLFKEKLGFEQISFSNAFQEVTLELIIEEGKAYPWIELFNNSNQLEYDSFKWNYE